MRIRTQLIGAFLLLAVVPLASIVLYSYSSSIQAVQRAVEAEARERTEVMDEQMAAIQGKLAAGVARLRDFPFGSLLDRSGAEAAEGAFVLRLMSEIGDAAPYVESLTLVPREAPGAPEAPPAPPAPGALADPEIPPLKIDVTELMKAYRESAEAAEIKLDVGAEVTGRIAEEVGLETAEIVALSLRQAAAAIREGMGGEAPEGEEIEAEVERRAEDIGHRVERLQQRLLERAEHARAIASIHAEESRLLEEKRRHAERLLGQELGVEIRDRGAVVGEVHAEISPGTLVSRVLDSTPRGPGEVPFALDADGNLYPAEDADLPLLESLDLYRDPRTGRARARRGRDRWLIVSTVDPDTDFAFGVAHPIGDSLARIRRTTARNLGIGLALVGLALLGILPLSKRITRGLEAVTEGAERVAGGDLSARVPVLSKNEIGQLAAAFNHMAEDLAEHQRRLVEEEGRRKEQELEKRYLEEEFRRKSRELEDARQFQLSLLPKDVPRHPAFEVAVAMRTATEVGGDYYDFHLAEGGALTLAVGDATGHGARAGTMVTVVKSLFSSSAAALAPGEFLRQATRAIKRMDLGRMAMALTLARLEAGRLTLSAAGMPPVLVHRAASGDVEEVAFAGMPLGALDVSYEEKSVEIAAGDTLLFLSDGLPELADGDGEPLGYAEVRRVFAAAAGKPPQEIIEELTEAAARWTGGQPPSDDMTFVVVEARG